MTIPLGGVSHHRDQHPSTAERPLKRLKVVSAQSDSHDDSHEGEVVRRHPLGVRPSGNALTAGINLKVASGLFTILPDELLMQLLESFEARDLLYLGGTCRALHAFTRSEELWRALFVA